MTARAAGSGPEKARCEQRAQMSEGESRRDQAFTDARYFSTLAACSEVTPASL